MADWRHQLLGGTTAERWAGEVTRSGATNCRTLLLNLLWWCDATFNDSLWIHVWLRAWTLRISWLLNRRRDLLRRWRVFFLSGLLIVNYELASDNWQFFIIFVKLAIEIVIIDLVEKCNVLRVDATKVGRLHILEILLVEGDGTDSRIQVVVYSSTWVVAWTLHYIFGNETHDRFWICQEILTELHCNIGLQFVEVWTGVSIRSQVRNVGVVHEDLYDGGLLIELLSSIISWIEDGLGALDVELDHILIVSKFVYKI